MRKRSIFILICWIILGFFLYIGYAENFDLPILNLPPAYSYLPALLQTQESTIVFLITGLVLGIVSIAMFFSKPDDAYVRRQIREFEGKKQDPDKKPRKVVSSGIGTSIRNGITRYSKRYSKSQAAIEREASKLTMEEAWIGLRDSYWDGRIKSLKKLEPDIHKEIIYWENHLNDYNTYMAMKLIFKLPYYEYDFWVRRNIRT